MDTNTVQLCRFKNPLSPSDLPEILGGTIEDHVLQEKIEEVDTGDVDFTKLYSAIEQAKDLYGSETAPQRAQWDHILVQPLHEALKDLTYADALDMRIWHWLCVRQFPDLVIARWGIDPAIIVSGTNLSSSVRFIGKNTLEGISHNTLTRLWWAAHSLYTEADGYDLAQALFIPQDLFTSLIDRQLGLNQNLLRACVKALTGKPGKEIQVVCKRLSQWATTINFELLDQDEILALMENELL